MVAESHCLKQRIWEIPDSAEPAQEQLNTCILIAETPEQHSVALAVKRSHQLLYK